MPSWCAKSPNSYREQGLVLDGVWARCQAAPCHIVRRDLATSRGSEDVVVGGAVETRG